MNSHAPAVDLGIDCRDPQQCMALIASLPLTKTGQVHRTLTALLQGLALAPPPAASYLQVLEMARTPLAFAQEETASRYALRSLVPGRPDDKTLDAVVRLWRLMAQAYAQVASLGGENPAIQNRLALICHRCIHYAGKPALEYYRARRELPKGLWSDLYGYFSTAEEWGIADTPVAEPLNDQSQSQSCAQALAAVILVDLGNPFGRSPREFPWLARWSQRFSVFTEVQPADETCDNRRYAVDLIQDRGPRPLELVGVNPNVRRLITTRLADEMHRVIAQLKAKVAPADLGLGENVFEPAASRLLTNLYRPWCLASSPRRFQRRQATGTAKVCYGFDAIHYFVNGAEFIQPAHVRMYSRSEFETIVTFRYQVDPGERLHVKTAQVEYLTETWQVADQSVNGFRIRRENPGESVEHGQLLGVRASDSDVFLLGQVSWLMYEANGGLTAGVHVLPGVPLGVAIRPSGPMVSHSERYVRAFLLPELPALKEPTSLVLPKGWFEPERVLDVYSERSTELRLQEILTQGPDFERVSFISLRHKPVSV